MILPETGKIVVIDDNVHEALPLIHTLSKHKIPHLYFNNDEKLLPNKPLIGIRIVFLDLQLIPGTNGHQISGILINLLEKIVSKDNGPFLLLVWSQKEDLYLQDLKDRLNDSRLHPISILSLTKADYFFTNEVVSDIESEITKFRNELETRFEEDDVSYINIFLKNVKDKFDELNKPEYRAVDDFLKKIEKKIESELEKVKAFHLFTIWDNLVNKSAVSIINDFSNFYELSENWDENTLKIFHKLAVANAGQNLNLKNTKEIIKNSLQTFNVTFLDSLEYKVNQELFPEIAIPSLIPENISNIEFEKLKKQDNHGLLNSCYEIKTSSDSYGLKKNISRKNSTKLVNFFVPDLDIIIPKINSKLLLSFEKNDEAKPGSVYLLPYKLNNYYGLKFDSFFNSEINCNDIRYVLLECSPSCDFAQKKRKICRVLPGVMFNVSAGYKKLKNTDYIIKDIPIFDSNNISWKIVFDLSLFSTEKIYKMKDAEYLFTLNHQLFVKIQSQIAQHINRPGILYLDENI